jgi:hypothetical protein
VRQVINGYLAFGWLHGGAGFREYTEERLLEDTQARAKGKVAGVGEYNAIHWLVGGNARGTLPS